MRNISGRKLKFIRIPNLHSLKLEFGWDTRAGPVISIFYGKRKLGLALICHRKESRCIEIFGHKGFLCARCTGLGIGIVTSFLIQLLGLSLNGHVPQFFGLLLASPMVFDGLSQLLGIRESTNSIRLLTGFLFSFGLLSILVS